MLPCSDDIDEVEEWETELVEVGREWWSPIWLPIEWLDLWLDGEPWMASVQNRSLCFSVFPTNSKSMANCNSVSQIHTWWQMHNLPTTRSSETSIQNSIIMLLKEIVMRNAYMEHQLLILIYDDWQEAGWIDHYPVCWLVQCQFGKTQLSLPFIWLSVQALSFPRALFNVTDSCSGAPIPYIIASIFLGAIVSSISSVMLFAVSPWNSSIHH